MNWTGAHVNVSKATYFGPESLYSTNAIANKYPLYHPMQSGNRMLRKPIPPICDEYLVYSLVRTRDMASWSMSTVPNQHNPTGIRHQFFHSHSLHLSIHFCCKAHFFIIIRCRAHCTRYILFGRLEPNKDRFTSNMR